MRYLAGLLLLLPLSFANAQTVYITPSNTLPGFDPTSSAIGVLNGTQSPASAALNAVNNARTIQQQYNLTGNDTYSNQNTNQNNQGNNQNNSSNQNKITPGYQFLENQDTPASVIDNDPNNPQKTDNKTQSDNSGSVTSNQAQTDANIHRLLTDNSTSSKDFTAKKSTSENQNTVHDIKPADKPALSFTVSGEPEIIDAITMVIQTHVIVLYGVKAPGMNQACYHSNGISWNCGQDARDALEKIIDHQSVTCHVAGNKGICVTDTNGDITKDMILAGYAVPDESAKPSVGYTREAQYARQSGRGIYQ